MRKTAWTSLVLSVAVAALVSGCSAGPATKPAAGGSTSSGTSAEQPFYAKPYPSITPESANEKKAVANAAKALASYITNTEAGNKQNGTNTAVFTNKEGYEPRFVGYGFDVLSGKLADGKFGSIQIAVFDSAKQIKPYSLWERFGSVKRGDGKMNDTYYQGVRSTMDSSAYLVGLTPESAGEKAAMAAVQAWANANAEPGFDKVLLTGYAIQYGEGGKSPNMMMVINPEGTGYGAVANMGSQ
jgi:hypothetical protein